MSAYCQIEHVFSDSDIGMPCGKAAVAKCADCGSAICSDCCTECCGDSFCAVYDYPVKPVQKQRLSLSRVDGSQSKHARYFAIR